MVGDSMKAMEVGKQRARLVLFHTCATRSGWPSNISIMIILVSYFLMSLAYEIQFSNFRGSVGLRAPYTQREFE